MKYFCTMSNIYYLILLVVLLFSFMQFLISKVIDVLLNKYPQFENIYDSVTLITV